MNYVRPHFEILQDRLRQAPQFLTVVAGPRQVGKTTLVRSVLRALGDSPLLAADNPIMAQQDTRFHSQISLPRQGSSKPNVDWLIGVWEQARQRARERTDGTNYILAIDEIQTIPKWSGTVKGLWDADRAEDLNLHVVLLGSSPWLMQKGLTESLAGRFMLLQMAHWAYPEMQAAFDFSLDEYIFFGAYPGAANLIKNESDWRSYVRSSLIATAIDTDILQLTRVDKPALLKNLFELGCAYSGQIYAYTKLLQQLHDAGNTTTLTHYLTLLGQAGFITGLSKYTPSTTRQRASPPKLNVLNTALVSAQASYYFAEAKADRAYWGRLVESTVGAHLINTASELCTIWYWNDGANEVDFVLTDGRRVLGIEVKSGRKIKNAKGMQMFIQTFPKAKVLIVGAEGIGLPEFLSRSANDWLAQ
ncbi:MAG: AAA family ATPase [Cytophagales bacterium]|nr:AAA family ATPase [Cytophagales bacterium]